MGPKFEKQSCYVYIGCGGGTLLDHISNVSSRCIGVEPNLEFSNFLKKEDMNIHLFTKECLSTYKNKIDIVVSTQVIEHVEDPKKFLNEIKKFIKTKGRNRNDYNSK